MNKYHVLYFNGLGSGKTSRVERLAFRYLTKRGIHVAHAHVDWRSHASFTSLFKRMIILTQAQLREHGHLLLVGSSAGGSLAVNVAARLHNKNLHVITLCSRLQLADLSWWDYRSLERMAHLGTSQASQLFFDSVTHCSTKAIPQLNEADKQRIIIVRQWADTVVPRATMGIEGVRIYRVPAFGHNLGIAMGVRRLPEIIKRLNSWGMIRE